MCREAALSLDTSISHDLFVIFTSRFGNQVLSARSPLNKVTTFPLTGGDTVVDNKSLLTLLPCRCKGGISQYPQLVFGLWRNWNISQHIAQCMMKILTDVLDTDEAWIMSNQTCCSACSPCYVWSGAECNSV